MANFLKLVCDLISDVDGFNFTVRANTLFCRQFMPYGFSRKTLLKNVFFALFDFVLLRLIPFSKSRKALFLGCWPWVVTFCFIPKIFAVALLHLKDENIKLFLKFFYLLPQLFVAFTGGFGFFLKLINQFNEELTLFSQSFKFFLFCFRHYCTK